MINRVYMGVLVKPMGCLQTTAVTSEILVLQSLQQTATLLPLEFSTGTVLYVDKCNIVWKISKDLDNDVAQLIHANNTLIMSLPACSFILAPTATEQLSESVVCTCIPFAGPDLFEWIQTPFSWEQAVVYLVDIAKGITWLHKHKVGHGDIKPENVVVGKATAQLIDFDFSVSFENWHYSGTRYYMVPLDIVKSWKTDNSTSSQRMDVYAYGKTILTVLYFYSYHTSPKRTRWINKRYITKEDRHTYTGKQAIWADLAFLYCSQIPPTCIMKDCSKLNLSL